MRIFQQLFFILMLPAIAGIDPCMGQKNLTDSLKDEEKAERLLQLGRLSDPSDRDKSISYFKEALEYTHDPFDRGVIMDSIGLKYWQGGFYPEAIQYFMLSLSLFEVLKDSLWLGKVTNNIAVVNWGMDNSNEAMKYYQESLRIRKAINDKRGVSTVLNNIGLIYLTWGMEMEAFARFQEAMEIAKEIDDVNALAYSYTNLGAYYKYMKQYDEAIKHYKLGFETEVERGVDKVSYSYFLANIGGGFMEEGSLDSALSYYDRALYHAFLINNQFRVATAQYNLGKTYLMLNSVDSAQKYLQLSFEISREKNYPTLLKDNQFALAELEEKLGNFHSAYNFYKRATELNDSIFSQSKLLRFNELQIQYNLQQEMNENTLLRKNIEINKLTIRKQNISRIILVFSILMILFILILILKSRNTYMELTKRLQKTETELRDSNESKDRFLSIISHDLRNPITSLLGLSEFLKSKYKELSQEEIKGYIKMLSDTSEKAFHLLEDLLDWARAHSGKMVLQAKPVDLFDSITGVIHHLDQRARDKNISIENRVHENTLVTADEKAIDTVIRNIISNAIKFTKPGGRISIEAEKYEGEMRVSISDTGVGMSEKDLNDLFRIDIHHTSYGTNNEAGTGLGLILCKELLEKQGGRIWAESHLGNGSKFVFVLPLSI